MDETTSIGAVGVPGFTVVDKDGNTISDNPTVGAAPVGRRVYAQDGSQVMEPRERSKRSTHDYLLRAPKGLWKAFVRKCKQEGFSVRDILMFLIKDWVVGKTEIEDLATRKKI